ncbi:methylglyoxal synthase [Pelagibaculum spongiae]|uniref:Methylglyoxal synthase n=1 Tax=Pelagibaculum spongiae TaxID=2080658 RepID=A0A2V1GY03_9GAMM|nr:methylglyoxal synthase [Pelagibaculum spongiae]PVZ69515.1 methylglyoxal synthase [Pelagibaculum spongiae]
MTEQKKRTVALVAHDGKKPHLLDWAHQHHEILKQFNLCATGTTGAMISKELDLPIQRLESGPLGGDQQIGAMIVEQKIDLLVFFWDPLEAQPHDPDVRALLRIASVWNIPVACNRATADLLFSSPILASYQANREDFASYRARTLD